MKKTLKPLGSYIRVNPEVQSETQEKIVQIDNKTGEVTLKFTLPGF